MGDYPPPSAADGGSPMTTEATSVAGGVVEAYKEEWERLLAADLKQMTDYERIEMEQDVQGKNRLAAISPSITTKMGMKNMRKELLRMREEYERKQDHVTLQPHSQTQDLDEVTSSGTNPQFSDRVRQSLSPTSVARILNQESVVKDDEILLRFLLADRLNAEKAAKRLVDYYSLAMDLFGDHVLRRPVLLGELNRQERRLLESGWIQLLLTRDTAGRRIMTVDEVGPADPSNVMHKLKVFMYVFQVAAMDSETQKQGLHFILHRLFSPNSPTGTVNEDAWTVDAHERQLFQRFFACAPVRCSIIHINTPSPEKWVRILPSVIQTMGKDERGRIRFHEGSITNCHKAIEEYGVPVEWMPMTSTGRRKLNEHKQWIKIQREREIAWQQGQLMEIVECPQPNDILLTKTRRASGHPGNQKLRQVLENRYEERYSAHPMKKQSITSQVADHLEEKLHARFLVKNKESFWVPADRNVVLDKLGNCFRFVPRLKPKLDAPLSPEKGSASEADLGSKPAAKLSKIPPPLSSSMTPKTMSPGPAPSER